MQVPPGASVAFDRPTGHARMHRLSDRPVVGRPPEVRGPASIAKVALTTCTRAPLFPIRELALVVVHWLLVTCVGMH